MPEFRPFFYSGRCGGAVAMMIERLKFESEHPHSHEAVIGDVILAIEFTESIGWELIKIKGYTTKVLGVFSTVLGAFEKANKYYEGMVS